MAGYLGNTQKISGRYTVDEFTSSGGTTYTLSSAPGDKNNIQVSAGGLVQYPSAYSVSGTTLTLSGVPSGQKVVVRHMGDTIPFPALDDNVVTSAKIASNSVTGAKIALGSDAAGDTMYYNGTDYARLAKGTAAQVLTMNAGATAPEWAAAGGGGGIWEYVSTVTASTSSTLAFTNMVAGYDYRYVIEELFVSTDTAVIRAQLGVTTPTYRTSGYLSVATTIINNNSSQSGEATAHIQLTTEQEYAGTGTDEGIKYAELTLINPAGTSVATMVMGFIFLYGHSPQAQVQHFGSFYNTADEAHTAIKFFMSSGTITTGNILQYRRARS